MYKQTSVPMEVSRPMTMSPENSRASDKTLFGDSLLVLRENERRTDSKAAASISVLGHSRVTSTSLN